MEKDAKTKKEEIVRVDPQLIRDIIEAKKAVLKEFASR